MKPAPPLRCTGPKTERCSTRHSARAQQPDHLRGQAELSGGGRTRVLRVCAEPYRRASNSPSRPTVDLPGPHHPATCGKNQPFNVPLCSTEAVGRLRAPSGLKQIQFWLLFQLQPRSAVVLPPVLCWIDRVSQRYCCKRRKTTSIPSGIAISEVEERSNRDPTNLGRSKGVVMLR